MHSDFCIITIELPLWLALKKKLDYDNFTHIDKWLYLLTHVKGEEKAALLRSLREPEYAEAIEIMGNFTITDKLRYYYQKRANYQHIVASFKHDGYIEGEKQKAIDIAKKLKALGIDENTISDTTGLDKKEIDTF